VVTAEANFGVRGGQGGCIQSLALKIHVICDYYEVIMNYSYLFKPLPMATPPYPQMQNGRRAQAQSEHTRTARKHAYSTASDHSKQRSEKTTHHK